MSDANDLHEEQRKIPLMTRVSARDRDSLYELARRFDRSLSKEIGRAIQFYVAHFEMADRAIQDKVEQKLSRSGDR